MNVQFANHQQIVEYLDGCEVLAELAGPGNSETIVAVCGGIDILIVIDPTTGAGAVITPCSEDTESGGSVHFHARESLDYARAFAK